MPGSGVASTEMRVVGPDGSDARVGRLAGVFVYPIKSAGGVQLDVAQVASHGFELDRRWMLIDASGEFVSQRTVPRMALLSVEIHSDHLLVRAPGMPDLPVDIAPESGRPVDARIWSDVCTALAVDEAADAWLSEFLQQPVRLVHLPRMSLRRVDPGYAEPTDVVGFADAFPFLLTSVASLADLNGRAGTRLPMDRFRPNLVVSGFEAFAEDAWSRIRIGDVAFRVVKPCARCSVTTVDQDTAEVGKEPLRTLATYRRVGGKVMFGQNLIQDGEGRLRSGDRVEVVSYRDSGA